MSNENQEAVNIHWDDFTVYHGKTNVVSTQDYYPFGLTFNESVRVASVGQRFKYNGKERQTDFNLNWDHFGSRIHMPEIGRFTTIDPKAEKYNFQNPYAYAANNPIQYVELNGEGPGDTKKGQFSSRSGDSYVYRSGSGKIHATRLTTTGRQVMTLARTAGGLTTAGAAADAIASFSTGDNMSGSTSTGSLISGGIGSAFQTGASNPSLYGLSNTADVVDNIGKGFKIGGNALMALPGLVNGLSGPTQNEILEEMTFNVVVKAGAGNLIGGEGNVLMIGDENASPESVADMLNVIYNGLSEQFSDLDLTSKDGKEAAYKFLKNNFEDFYNSVSKE